MLSFEGSNYPICSIQNKDDKTIAQIYLLDKKKDKNAKDAFSEMIITDEHKLVHIPNLNNERCVQFVAGMSGSGKSYYIRDFVYEYIKKYPKRSIYLFSYLPQDTTLDKVKKIQRVNIDGNDFLNSNLTSSDFTDSLVIFDDIDCIPNKRLKDKVMNLLQQMLQIGRHDKVSVCYACHEVCNAKETKPILNECQSITIFPKTMGTRKLNYLLENYFGMDKIEIAKVKNIDSRFVTILKSYPKVVFGSHEIYIL